jgi:hypothetical protein
MQKEGEPFIWNDYETCHDYFCVNIRMKVRSSLKECMKKNPNMKNPTRCTVKEATFINGE